MKLLDSLEDKAAGWAFKKFLARGLINWKTSLGGISAILSGLAALITYLANAAGTGEFHLDGVMQPIGVIAGGVALLAARDADKSSGDNAIPKAEIVP